ncbi:hypothetical protein [Halopiger djelfimassiliensis]|uniref:hypothetical protein n=1 Tax=Halopiger djelfimassiliensis TaxID=1293047 RepID=UPI0006783493|nr:hypothetical protein [Halopiger djelfimassiliensis]
MDTRGRLLVGSIWIAVAGLMAMTLEPAVPSSAGEIGRLFVVVLALGLACVYLLDPWNIVSQQPFQ